MPVSGWQVDRKLLDAKPLIISKYKYKQQNKNLQK